MNFLKKLFANIFADHTARDYEAYLSEATSIEEVEWRIREWDRKLGARNFPKHNFPA